MPRAYSIESLIMIVPAYILYVPQGAGGGGAGGGNKIVNI
jgi:hypothetical protein